MLSMPLLKKNTFVTDSWTHLGMDDVLPASGLITVPYERLEKEWDTLVRFTGLLGVRLSNTAKVQNLEPYISQVTLVIVPFPAFNDGRAYSIARQLRLDGFRGELRATGNILPDQLQFMLQVGIDAFDVNDRFALDVWQRASRQMSLAYQRGLYRTIGEKEVWSERHQGFAAWEEQPHAG
jgi:uncharacterized protein (DUF934 family)